MKALFMNQSLFRKQISILLLVGLLPMAIVSILSEKVAEEELSTLAYGQLESVREIKAEAVKRYFHTLEQQVLNLAETREVISAMDAFARTFDSMASRDGFESQEDFDRLKQQLSTIYQKDFQSEYQKRNDGNSANINSMLSTLSNQAVAAQYQYIFNNSNPLGEKHNLDKAEGSANYHRMHMRYHDYFRSFLERFGYYDIFLLEPENGVIVYSVFKELDYGTSLIKGPYSNTNFASAYKEALQLKPGEFVLKDYAIYPPSYDSPASFVATPIYDDNKLRGVLVFQMPLETINAIMNQRDGMGESGESYLVGPDYLMRSDSALNSEYSVTASFQNPDSIAVQTQAIERAFQGEVGADVMQNYSSNTTLSAFSTVNIGSGIEWAVVAEKTVEEAFAGVATLTNTLILIGLIGFFLIVGFAWVVSKALTKPILQLSQSIQKVQKSGEFNNKIENKFTDEIGETSRAFNHLLDNLSNVINASNDVLNAVSSGDYSKTIAEQHPGQLGVLTEGVNNAVGDIKRANEEQERQAEKANISAKEAKDAAERAEAQAREVLVIKKALDSSATSTLITDNDYNLVYTNEAFDLFLAKSEKDFQEVLPGFVAQNVIGKNIDVFLKNTEYQHPFLDKLTAIYSSEITIGQLTLTITATPIIDNGQRVGMIVEWADRTEEVAIEQEIDEIVTAAANGNFDKNLTLNAKEGFSLKLSEGLNQLLDTTNIAITDVKRVFSALAEGDLSQQIDRDYQGGFAQLKVDANATVDKLREVIGEIGSAASSISQGASEISLGNHDLSSRTESQAATLEETSASMEEMTQIVRNSEDNAKEASQLAARTAGNAMEGNKSVQETIQAMQDISQASNKIANIIGVIDEIAFQTNLLALNAAVEAARAGEQGRGFAVVAGEVRTLAQRSAGAAKEIKGLIEDSVKKVDDGSRLVTTSGDTLNTIVSEIEAVNTMIQNIATSAREQTVGIEQVNEAVSQMDHMTQQNAALVEEAASASQNMSEQSKEMTRLVDFFNR